MTPPISGCTNVSVNCYTAISNSTVGLNGLFDYARDAVSNYPPTSLIGGSMIGLLLLLPVFLIIFLPLSRTGKVVPAITVASFICWLLSIPLIILQYVNVAAFMFFLAVTVAGALITFNADR